MGGLIADGCVVFWLVFTLHWASLRVRDNPEGSALVRATDHSLPIIEQFGKIFQLPPEWWMKSWFMYDTNITGHFLTPLYCLYLYGSATNGGVGFSSYVLRLGWLAGLGDYAFPAYLWSEFLARVCGATYAQIAMMPGAAILGVESYKFNTPTNTWVLVLALWLWASLYTDQFEAKFVPWIRPALVRQVTRLLRWGSDQGYCCARRSTRVSYTPVQRVAMPKGFADASDTDSA